MNSIVSVSLIFPIIITCDGNSIKFSNGLIPTPIIERVSSADRERERKIKCICDCKLRYSAPFREALRVSIAPSFTQHRTPLPIPMVHRLLSSVTTDSGSVVVVEGVAGGL